MGDVAEIKIDMKRKSFDSMDKMELKAFIEYLFVLCECDAIPKWWPAAIDWLRFTPNTLSVLQLKQIVLSCYVFHDELYTLYLSEQLAKMDFDDLEYSPVGENITVIFNKITKKPVLVTVNENIVSVQ